ncbi:uncharacterized protein DUF4824 [Thiogranum longum]|uniref:Uncharacterized protein DUF4824 n=1 Tax=Thiogranum longum TaxID=1537524 RepID=A0A4R1HLZ8_9GAMM|nr:DUF4824 family protein [Thiogranum longum]TCK18242.1 uncharacterized protein DUF4824 [Thiogranum longum]
MTWKNRHTWIAGLGIIILTNALALAGLAYNRSGEPDARVMLSERELKLPYYWGRKRENSGLALTLNWRMNSASDNKSYYSSRYSPAPWLNQAKLALLGFPVEEATGHAENRRRLNHSLPREAFLVLEFNGPAYQAELTRQQMLSKQQQALADRNPGNQKLAKAAKDSQERLQHEQYKASRLFVIDVGLDAQVLRQHYPDSARYIVQRGSIRARVNKQDDQQWVVQGFVSEIAITRVNIPLQYRSAFEPFMIDDAGKQARDPNYQVTLAYGQRLEPWVVRVESGK